MLEDAFYGFKGKGRLGETELLELICMIARVLGRGSLHAGTLVCQGSHWFYVGSARAAAAYKACINVLLSSQQLHCSCALGPSRVLGAW